MADNDFTLSTERKINRIEVDGQDIMGLFYSISIYENVYNPIVFGTLVMMDSDSVNFTQEYNIQGMEPIEIEFENANGEILQFKGKLNGTRNKAINQQRMGYTFDFNSDQLKHNESNFVYKRIKNTPPEKIIEDMVEILQGEMDDEYSKGTGMNMNFQGNSRRPTEIMKQVVTEGVTPDTSEEKSSEEHNSSAETKGTTGFLVWQTTESKYRFNSVDQILDGQAGKDWGELTSRLQQNDLTMEESMNSIISYDFKELGDYQAKLRSGAYKILYVCHDMDKGQTLEYEQDATGQMTEKVKEDLKDVKYTRRVYKAKINEGYNEECVKADANYWDQSTRYLNQNIVRQNTFDDQTGHMTLPPRFEMHAGDVFTAKIPIVKSENGAGYDEKITGRYVCKQVAHHIDRNSAYTKVTTVRSTIQQDDSSSRDTTNE